MIFAAVEIPWPFLWLGTLLTIGLALASAAVILRASTIRANLELLRGERDDYRDAYNHEKEEKHQVELSKKKVELDLQKEREEGALARSSLQLKIDVLEGVVSGTSAIKELGDLMVMVTNNNHRELLAALKANSSELKTLSDSIHALLGDSFGRRRDDSELGSEHERRN